MKDHSDCSIKSLKVSMQGSFNKNCIIDKNKAKIKN